MPPKKTSKKSKQQRAPNGSVTAEIRGKSLGLRLPERHFGNQRYFALLLPDTSECRAIAELKAKELELELALGTFDGNLEKFRPPLAPQTQPKSAITLADLWQEYAEFRRPHVSPSTWKNGYLVMASHSRQCPIQDLRKAIDILDWAIATLTPDTTERFLMQINAACKWALTRGKMATNPFEGLRQELRQHGKSGQQTRQAPKVFWKDEQQIIIKTFEQQQPELSGLIKFFFLTGCRTAEALGIRWINIAPDRSFLNFEKSLIIAKGGELEFRLSRSKSAIAVRLANSSQERQWWLATSYQAQP